MTRVAIVAASAAPGGAERALVSLVRTWPASEVEPFAVLLQPGPLENWLADAGCPVVVLEAGRTRQLYRTAGVVRALRQLIIDRHADVVLSTQSKSHVYGGAAATLARIPAIWWQHEIPRRNPIELTAGRVRATAVVCGSRAAVDAQRRLTPRRRIVCIPPGVDVAGLGARRGSGVSVRQALGWERNRIVGIVGRLQPSKGQTTFLHAAALLARDRPDLRFAVVGGAVLGWEGAYPDDLRRLADELGLADRLHFAGHQDDVVPWLDAFDVAVHAAANEPFGLVLVEAMALGKPLVASNTGGPADIVEHGVSGLLVPPGKPDELAAEVGMVLDDPALAAALACAAPKRAEMYSDQRAAGRFAELLHGIAAGEPARRQLQVARLTDR
jgi:glycosyltransferase involved in cell wall biosynthesis